MTSISSSKIKTGPRDFIDSQPPQEQERAEKLTIQLLEVAATKIVPGADRSDVIIASRIRFTASDWIFSTTRATDHAAAIPHSDCRGRSSIGCLPVH